MTSDPVSEYQTDHDLLVRLDERYASMHGDIRDLKNGTNKRLDNLEKDVKNLQLWRSALVGAFAVFDLILIPAAFAYFA
jgi:hypothetical protein